MTGNITVLEKTDFASISQQLEDHKDGASYLLIGDYLPEQIRSLRATVGDVFIHSTSLPLQTQRHYLSGPTSLQDDATKILQERGLEPVVLGEAVHLAACLQLVEKVLRLGQTALSAEALALGSKTGVNPKMIYKAVASALGSSWSWVNDAARMISGDFTPNDGTTLEDALSIMSSFAAEAKLQKVSTPLTSLIRQSYVSAAAQSSSSSVGPSAIFKNYGQDLSKTEDLPEAIRFEDSDFDGKVAFIGLGAMGLGMASVMHKANIQITGYDVWKPSLDKFSAIGGKVASSAREASEGAKVVVLMVLSHVQAEETLFEGGVADVLAKDGVVLLMSTVSPSAAQSLQSRLSSHRPDLHILDCPVSGGVGRAASGDLTLLCGGEESGIKTAWPVLRAMSGSLGNAANLWIIPGGVGKGSAVKMAHQAAAGCNINLVTEINAYAARVGLPLRQTREILLESKGRSGLLLTRGKNMLDGKISPPDSAVNIWLKDLGIVVEEAEVLGVPVYFSAYVLQANVLASSYGWGGDDDSSLVRLWQPAGIKVAQE